MSSHNFDLLREPWLRMRHAEGHVEEVGLLEFYDRAEQFTDLAGESDTQNQAVFRLLLAIFIRALRHHALFGQEDRLADTWQKVQAADDLGALVGEYLKAWEDRFDLFDTSAPFFQAAGLHTQKEEHSDASVLVPDTGPGLFSTSTSAATKTLPAAAAARWLVYTQAYDVSGIKSGAVGDPRVKGGKGYPIGTGWAGAIGAVQVMGPTLQDTLVLNLPVRALLAPPEEIDADLPPWEREPADASPRSVDEVTPTGVVDVLTWQQRRVRLFPDQEGNTVVGALICNGDKIRRANNFMDPTTGYRYSRAQSKNGVDVFFPKTHDPALTVWRGMQSLFEQNRPDEPEDRKPAIISQLHGDLADVVNAAYEQSGTTLRLTGMSYGTQDAVVDGEVSETYPVRVQLLTDRAQQLWPVVVGVVGRVMSFRGSMAWFHKQLLVCAGASPEEAPQAPVQAWLAALEAQFVAWLDYLGGIPAPEDAEREWGRRMRTTTLYFIAEAVAAAGPRAAIGRTEESEAGKLIIHSSARYELWITKKLAEIVADTALTP
ncbi:type I-E CRISPR-associated protein Cse1/CasA [Kocuria indica]|uniref:Type I-E CRISPR-associated protein Cse1/CasA n=1 Tax=Kocuria marina subsp. indica TaxID=1049583 RepID=A0A6N9R1F8_9MICC|nr:type I-E CRISPR-associated protein Cse1/CasA [Kocuria indica]